MDLKLTESSSSDATRKWKYDVYLSFGGGDSGNTFTNHLYNALEMSGIFTLRDDNKIIEGENISPELLKAIEMSRISVVVFSKNYASSTWFLDDLVKILECQSKMGQTVFPVFYHVDPSEVRTQKGSFAEAFAIYEKRFKENLEKVHRWRNALVRFAKIAGWKLQDGSESELIQQIVERILFTLRPIQLLSTELLVGPIQLLSTELLVGIASRVEEILPYFEIGLTDVRILGICGMRGVGKSTIARVIYDRLSNQFEGSCFLTDVREVAQRSGIICLQKRLLSDISLERDLQIYNVREGVNLIRERLCRKRILLVLDDVDDSEQLEILALQHDCFGPGSRIIITSRDEHLLRRHGVDQIYWPKVLSYNEALDLFSLKSFNKNHPPKDYMEMSNQFLELAAGLPLVINVLGSLLYGRSIQEWESVLQKLKLVPENEIQKVLQISFDGLDR